MADVVHIRVGARPSRKPTWRLSWERIAALAFNIFAWIGAIAAAYSGWPMACAFFARLVHWIGG